ncbi:hypothetical protein SAMD00019534_098040, partial [Acytostelium subglobosum LB1]|uniref:hypothetical protein n=1 Tax=Acytostelium subglobosum LB1 TaxID=1410327 RepID=UPI00064497FF
YSNQSSLYEVASFGYQIPFYVANMTGSHYEMGYAYGTFFAEAILEVYNNLMYSILPNTEDIDAMELFIDWQYQDFLSKQMPKDFVDEMQGVVDGATSVGMPDLGPILHRAITLANFPGDIEANIEYLLSGLQCSHFSVWGNRTVNGDMFNGRNLDWFAGTGISQHKVLAVYHPTDGYSHLSVSFAGLVGGMTGISSNGIFTAESDSDSKLVTFEGFAWAMRIRWVMEHAQNIDEALQLWRSTNNTMGMNHMLSSAFESLSNPHPAYALETMQGYTAFFPDNDPNEIFYYANSNPPIQMGYPIPQAVWRTNHGYDATIRKEQTFVQSPDGDSMVRYMLFHDNFVHFESTGANAIDELIAVNITSITGDKNNTDFYSCEEAWNGGNVISATFHSQNNTMFVAYEEGTGMNRLCACCNVYVHIDLSLWFGSASAVPEPNIHSSSSSRSNNRS